MSLSRIIKLRKHDASSYVESASPPPAFIDDGLFMARHEAMHALFSLIRDKRNRSLLNVPGVSYLP